MALPLQSTYRECSAYRTGIGPYSVTGIGTQAFELDQHLETIEFEEGTQITTTGDRAFSRCAKLRNIEPLASVPSLGVECFRETPTGQDASLRTDPIRNTSITTLPNGCFYLSSLPSSIKLPDGVTQLGDSSVVGQGNYARFVPSIEAADISDKKRFSFTPIADVSHTGRARDPKVQVKDTVTSKDLVEGKDFTVAYANNVNQERQRQR